MLLSDPSQRFDASPEQSTSYPSPVTGYCATVVLVISFTFSLVDRQILSLLIEPIKHDLKLSDTGVSLLVGLSFAVFYGTFGLLLGRIADRWDRRRLILISMAVWTLATGAGAYANTIAILFLARMMVGVGESSLSPAATSMIADLFPPDRRARPLSIYFAGAFVGGGLALVIGGMIIGRLSGFDWISVPFLGEFRPWQVTFLIVAAPGIPILLLMSTIREPKRRSNPVAQAHGADVSPPISLYAYLIIGFSIVASGLTFSLSAWAPTYFIRVWQWLPQQIGGAMGLIVMIGTPIGMIVTGIIADRMTRAGRTAASIELGIGAAILLVPTLSTLAFAGSAEAALCALALTYVLIGVPSAMAPLALQAITPNRNRGLIIAWYLLVSNILGMGVAPTIVALITDYGFRDEMKVGTSLGITGAGLAAVGLACMLVVARRYRLLTSR